MAAEKPDAPRPRLVPWLQVVGMVITAGIALADLIVEDGHVPWVVYGALIALTFGIGPDTVTQIFKHGR